MKGCSCCLSECVLHVDAPFGSVHNAIVAKPTSFAHLSLPDLAQTLKGQEESLQYLDTKLEETAADLQDSIARAEESSEEDRHAMSEVLKRSISDAANVQQRLHAFKTSIDVALKASLEFNGLVRRQMNFSENKLPSDVFGVSCAVVGNLQKAQILNQSLLQHDAGKLLQLAKMQNLKISGFFGMITECRLLLLVRDPRSAPYRVFPTKNGPGPDLLNEFLWGC